MYEQHAMSTILITRRLVIHSLKTIYSDATIDHYVCLLVNNEENMHESILAIKFY